MITTDDIQYRKDIGVQSREELYATIGGELVASGHVKESWPTALEARELEYPTGLPLPGGVAIPHTSAEHVTRDVIVVATTSTPLKFHEMGGNEDDLIEAQLVIFLVLAESHGHVKLLSTLIKALQDQAFREGLKSAANQDVVRALLADRLPLS